MKIGYIINESAAKPVAELDIVESGRRTIGEGVVQEADETNRNGRMYRLEDLAKEIVAPRQKELLSTGNMIGEAGHPLSKDLIRQQTIDPTKGAVRFTKFWMEGTKVKARFKGTNNALGDAFDLDLKEGILPAFSLRALGTLRQTPKGAIVENLKMITYDYVIYPSHPGAYTSHIVTESTGVAQNAIPNHLDATKSFITPFTNNDVVEKLQSYRESAIAYIKDKSNNYNLLKECFDMTKAASIDLINENQISIVDPTLGTIVMNIEDYIVKEIRDYV